MKKEILTQKIINFFKWIWQECKDWKTFVLLLCVVFVMYAPVWGGYLLHAAFGWAWCSAVASAYLLFWAGPFTPFFPVCIGITLSIKKALQLRSQKRNSKCSAENSNSETNKSLVTKKQMTLKTITVSCKNKYYSEICKLMKEAFPEAERMPIWLLKIMAKRDSVRFDAVIDGSTFCGLIYTAENEKYLFVLYLAVCKAVRSKGYGSHILELIKQRAGKKQVILHAEYPDATADNAIQRSKRMRFYTKNGIVNTGYCFDDGSEKYIVLSTDGLNVDIESYRKLLHYLSFGLYHPNIKNSHI